MERHHGQLADSSSGWEKASQTMMGILSVKSPADREGLEKGKTSKFSFILESF